MSNAKTDTTKPRFQPAWMSCVRVTRVRAAGRRVSNSNHHPVSAELSKGVHFLDSNFHEFVHSITD
jgi:hypothetical protein